MSEISNGHFFLVLYYCSYYGPLLWSVLYYTPSFIVLRPLLWSFIMVRPLLWSVLYYGPSFIMVCPLLWSVLYYGLYYGPSFITVINYLPLLAPFIILDLQLHS